MLDMIQNRRKTLHCHQNLVVAYPLQNISSEYVFNLLSNLFDKRTNEQTPIM